MASIGYLVQPLLNIKIYFLVLLFNNKPLDEQIKDFQNFLLTYNAFNNKPTKSKNPTCSTKQRTEQTNQPTNKTKKQTNRTNQRNRPAPPKHLQPQAGIDPEGRKSNINIFASEFGGRIVFYVQMLGAHVIERRKKTPTSHERLGGPCLP